MQTTHLIIIAGHPQSDIGKASLAAAIAGHLGRNAEIIKFDGFLNTNRDGRFPSRVDHDFVIYRQMKPSMPFGGAHLLLASDVLESFFCQHGSRSEHLEFMPHVAGHFADCVESRVSELGKPPVVVLELGGVVDDPEVSVYAIPGVEELARRYARTNRILLCNAGEAFSSVKAKPVERSIAAAHAVGYEPSEICARLPANLADAACENAEEYLSRKLEGKFLKSLRLTCIPFFRDAIVAGYCEFVVPQLLADMNIHGVSS